MMHSMAGSTFFCQHVNKINVSFFILCLFSCSNAKGNLFKLEVHIISQKNLREVQRLDFEICNKDVFHWKTF